MKLATAQPAILALLALVLSIASMGAEKTTTDAFATRKQILEKTRSIAWNFCHQPKYGIVRCNFDVMFEDNEWNVMATYVIRGPDGIEGVGGETTYVFSKSGELLRKIPGM